MVQKASRHSLLRHTEHKQLGTIETLQVILEHRKIMSECIREMDANGKNYIPEHDIFIRVKRYSVLIASDTRRRLRIAFATDNLLNANLVMDVDQRDSEQRLYFHQAVLDIVRLCDLSLFKKLTDVQLKTHLAFVNQSLRSMRDGSLSFHEDNMDFVEFMDNVFLQLSRLLSEIRQNIVKMQSIGKDLEALTVEPDPERSASTSFAHAKQAWLDEIMSLYERHILPMLSFLNPDTTYAHDDGLHSVLTQMSQILEAHQQYKLAQSMRLYALSLLNFYQPIEQTAATVNRFIHKEQASIVRFKALEHFYQQHTIRALKASYGDSLSKTKLGSEAIALPDFMRFNKGLRRQPSYMLQDSTAYYHNLLKELEARTQDSLNMGQLTAIELSAQYDSEAELGMQRFIQMQQIVEQLTLRETQDVIAMLHQRLVEQISDFAVYDLISAVQLIASQIKRDETAWELRTINRFAELTHGDLTYRYRRIICTSIHKLK